MQKIEVDLKKIKTIRKEKGLTQGYMASRLSYKTPIGYHYLETGRCQIKADQLAIIAKELGVEVNDLFFGDKPTRMVG
jgi:transcriptional regulator with XRE-family HTH domain